MFSQTAIPLDTVLKRSMSAAEKYNGLVENYTADVYMRTYVETLKKISSLSTLTLCPDSYFTIRNQTKP